jgi:prephenate dehydrogenase
MSKIAIIGLGLVGNSIGLALKRAMSEGNGQVPAMRVVGFDPAREKEGDALRRYLSVDEIASNLESAVRDAEMVIIATPPSAVREVLAALASLVAPDTVITDVLAAKVPVIRWAAELLGNHGGFVGGHPLSLDLDIETASETDLPTPNLFKNAPYCIVSQPHTSNQALNSVIGLAEAVGAKPLFIDAQEHDSFMAAATHLPALTGVALWSVVGRSPAWIDIQQLAHSSFASATEALGADPQTLADSIYDNRQAVVGWLDRLLISLQDVRDLLAAGDRQALLSEIEASNEGYAVWTEKASVPFEVQEARDRAESKAAINDARPSRSLLGTYLSDRIFRRSDKSKER